MIKLSSPITNCNSETLPRDRVIRVSSNPARPAALRQSELFIGTDAEESRGFWGYLEIGRDKPTPKSNNIRYFGVSNDLGYLADGDIVRISSDLKRIRVMFRVSSPHNSLLLTEQCNHYCLMCSQPPKDRDDSHLIEDIREVLRLAPKNCKEIGFTGGEPTLLGQYFVELVRLSESYLPNTALHVLSNGRAFADREFAKETADVSHHDLMIGIPIYSDAPEIHDYVVQADNALAGTIDGVLNLNRFSVPVEIRVVLHRVTVDRLVYLAEFIARNLPFVSHVAFMGLEMTGFARANNKTLWIEPDEYGETLKDAVLCLTNRGIRTSVYNLQLCLMPKEIWPFMQKSISDWKNEYEPECEECDAKEQCGGFFSSFIYQKPKNIKPISIACEV